MRKQLKRTLASYLARLGRVLVRQELSRRRIERNDRVILDGPSRMRRGGLLEYHSHNSVLCLRRVSAASTAIPSVTVIPSHASLGAPAVQHLSGGWTRRHQR